MVREIIAGILANFDYALREGTVRIRLRETNLTKFGELTYADIRDTVREMSEADKRVTVEERNRGFFVKFNGEVLFRVGVGVYSERAEVVIDGSPIVRYDGINPYYLEHWDARCKPSVAIKKSIINAFHSSVGAYLAKQLNSV